MPETAGFGPIQLLQLQLHQHHQRQQQ